MDFGSGPVRPTVIPAYRHLIVTRCPPGRPAIGQWRFRGRDRALPHLSRSFRLEQTTSPPETVTVIDYDFLLVGHPRQSLTYEPHLGDICEDRTSRDGDHFILTKTLPDGTTDETCIDMRHVVAMNKRTRRVMLRPAKFVPQP